MYVGPSKHLLGVAVASAALFSAIGNAHAVPFVVTDADFVSNVYDLRYYTQTNLLVENGVATAMDSTPLDDLFLTNLGNVTAAWQYFGSDSGVRYLQAPGGFSPSLNTSGAATMGWDFSAVSGPVATVELRVRSVLFQFSPWNDEAFGDTIYGDIATPSSFGAGPYTNLYSFTGNNVPLGSGPDAYESPFLDVTSFLPSGWLANPGLLEMRFGYELADGNLPGRQIQLFRNNNGDYPALDGFMLRVTLLGQETAIPEPATVTLLALGGLGLVARRRRKP